MIMGAPYEGRVGHTRRREATVWCGGCGVNFGAEWVEAINVDTDPDLVDRLLDDGHAGLNTVRCPECAWTYTIVEPLVVHRPGRGLYQVVPAHLRHRAQSLRAELIASVTEAPGFMVPAYALAPSLVGDIEEMLDLLTAGRSDAPTVTPAPRPVLDASDLEPAPDALVAPVIAPQVIAPPPPLQTPPLQTPARPVEEAALDALDSADFFIPAEPLHALPPAVLDDEPVGSAPDEPVVEPVVEPMVELMAHAELPEVASVAEVVLEVEVDLQVPAPVEEPVQSWDTALDDGWDLEAPPAAVEDEEATHIINLAEMKPSEAPSAMTVGDTHTLSLDGDRVQASAQVAPEVARRFEDGAATLRVQLHTPDDGAPVLALILLGLPEADDGPEVWWIIEPERAEHATVLNTLEQRFTVDVVFHDEMGRSLGRRRFRAPLEGNVARVRELAEGDHGAEALASARAAYAAPAYDRRGRLRHNFNQDSFKGLRSAAEARLALGILSYWSAPERLDYLLWIKSLPTAWFDQMSRRVLSGALDFGLAIAAHLRQRALEMELAESPAALVRRSLSNFAEVNLNLKSSGLDDLDLWENWEALLALAEELELRVDEEIEELAALAMNRARMSAQGSMLDAGSVSIELDEVSVVSELEEVELVNLLEDPAHRLEAAEALLQRGDPVFAPAVFEAIKNIKRGELLILMPQALAMGPAFESVFLTGLRSQRASVRLASALFLTEIRSERAVEPLLGMVLDAPEGEWRTVARAAGRMGRRILAPVATLVSERGDPDGRIAEVLALLGGDTRGALAALKARNASEAVGRCVDAALERMPDVSFGDAADFRERLSDAFRAAGPDLTGPDFEESLASVT